MVRNGHNVSICIWYEMVIMYRSAYGTKMIFTMVRNGRYEMVMVRNYCNSRDKRGLQPGPLALLLNKTSACE
jgi:hypothetical protein